MKLLKLMQILVIEADEGFEPGIETSHDPADRNHDLLDELPYEARGFSWQGLFTALAIICFIGFVFVVPWFIGIYHIIF